MFAGASGPHDIGSAIIGSPRIGAGRQGIIFSFRSRQERVLDFSSYRSGCYIKRFDAHRPPPLKLIVFTTPQAARFSVSSKPSEACRKRAIPRRIASISSGSVTSGPPALTLWTQYDSGIVRENRLSQHLAMA